MSRSEFNKIWSVETEFNCWNNDLFNGTLEECIKYCEDYDIELDNENARIAYILVDEFGCVLETLEYYED